MTLQAVRSPILRWTGVGVAAAGVVAGAVGVALVVTGNGRRDDIEAASSSGTKPYDPADGNWQSLQHEGIGFMIGGAVAIAGGRRSSCWDGRNRRLQTASRSSRPWGETASASWGASDACPRHRDRPRSRGGNGRGLSGFADSKTTACCAGHTANVLRRTSATSAAAARSAATPARMASTGTTPTVRTSTRRMFRRVLTVQARIATRATARALMLPTARAPTATVRAPTPTRSVTTARPAARSCCRSRRADRAARVWSWRRRRASASTAARRARHSSPRARPSSSSRRPQPRDRSRRGRVARASTRRPAPSSSRRRRPLPRPSSSRTAPRALRSATARPASVSRTSAARRRARDRATVLLDRHLRSETRPDSLRNEDWSRRPWGRNSYVSLICDGLGTCIGANDNVPNRTAAMCRVICRYEVLLPHKLQPPATPTTLACTSCQAPVPTPDEGDDFDGYSCSYGSDCPLNSQCCEQRPHASY